MGVNFATCSACLGNYDLEVQHRCATSGPDLPEWLRNIVNRTNYGPDTPPAVTRDRVKPLEAALKAIMGDRNDKYGEPEDSFAAWNALRKAYYAHSKGQHGEEHDTAIELLLLKVARVATGKPVHLDSYTDAAGYAGCAYELAVQHSKRMKES